MLVHGIPKEKYNIKDLPKYKVLLCPECDKLYDKNNEKWSEHSKEVIKDIREDDPLAIVTDKICPECLERIIAMP